MGCGGCHPGPGRAGAAAERLLVPFEPVATRLGHPNTLTAQQQEHRKKNPLLPLKESRNILIEPILPLAFQQGEGNLGIKAGSSCSLFSPSAPPHSISKAWRRCCRALREQDKVLGAGAGPFGSQTPGIYTWGGHICPPAPHQPCFTLPHLPAQGPSPAPRCGRGGWRTARMDPAPPTPPGRARTREKLSPSHPAPPGGDPA